MKRENGKKILVIVLVPLFFLSLVEIFLCMVGIGTPTGFFEEIQMQEKTVIRPNFGYMRRFVGPGMASLPSPVNFIFFKEKSTNARRVFVIGASTSYGFPYPPNMSFAGFLSELFVGAKLPIEVVNLSVTAAGSRQLREIVQACAQYHPDHVVLSFGHNEFIAPGGGDAGFAVNAAIAFRGLYLYQALENLVTGKGVGDSSQILLERLAKKALFARGSAGYANTLKNFRRNTARMFEDLRRIGCRVTVLLPVSNTGDFPPLASVDDASLIELVSSQGLITNGRWLFERFPDELVRKIQANPTWATTSANAAWLLGRRAWRAGAHEEAYRLLSLARDLDPIRLRAPSDVISILIEESAVLGNAVRVVDVEALLAGTSRIAGNREMTEYLHPTFQSHLKIAQTLFGLISGRQVPAAYPDTFSYVDLMLARDNLQRLFEGPLMRSAGYANWSCLSNDFELQEKDGVIKALVPERYADYRVMENMLAGDAASVRRHIRAAEFFFRREKLALMLREYQVALRLDPWHPLVINNLMAFAFQSGNKPAAAWYSNLLIMLMEQQALDLPILKNLLVFFKKTGQKTELHRVAEKADMRIDSVADADTLQLVFLGN